MSLFLILLLMLITCRLPLELVKFAGSRVLTVNNGRNGKCLLWIVVELLVRFRSSNDWQKSILEGVPVRKVDNEEQEKKQQEDEETWNTSFIYL